MSFTVQPVSPTLGVEIIGLAPARFTDADKREFKRLFDSRHFILIRNADTSEETHLGLVEAIGPISTADAIMKDGRQFTHISNVHGDGRLPAGELLYHSDHMFLETPLKAISLYAIDAPRVGGETRFLNAAHVYASLPDELKRRIADLSAVHVYDYDANRGNERATLEALSENSDTAIHPIVWTHPESGAPVLFISRLFTVGIVGLEQAESDALLDALFAHVDAHGDDYVHSWSAGDLIVWDNRILQHARNDFPPTERRALRRVPIGQSH